MSGTFDQLFVDTIKFNSVSKVDTMFFTLVVRSGQLSYRVWPFENGKFKKKFSFALKNGPAVSLNTSKEIHFGNVELDSGEVQKIINATRTQQAKYVIFKPYLTTDSEIADSIFVSKDTAISKSSFVSSFTGVSANPSPPKNY